MYSSSVHNPVRNLHGSSNDSYTQVTWIIQYTPLSFDYIYCSDFFLKIVFFFVFETSLQNINITRTELITIKSF